MVASSSQEISLEFYIQNSLPLSYLSKESNLTLPVLYPFNKI
jgi:hypothetical protein